MASNQKQWPVAIIVIAVILLIGPIIWALSLTMNVLAATGIGLVIAIVAIVAAFIWFKKRVDAKR
ncbi:MAG: hypothetical protein ACR2N2_04600 [Acidimicrobiia bacterium]